MKISRGTIPQLLFLSFSFCFVVLAGESENCSGRGTVVLVLGFPHGGTSCTAGVLSILGVPFGNTFCNKKDRKHPKGTFESHEMDNLDSAILQELGMGTFRPATLGYYTKVSPEQWQSIESRLRALLAPRLQDGKLVGIKDPRIAMLLPFYVDAIRSFGYDIKVVTVVRNPDEVAESLDQKRHDMHRLLCRYLASIVFYGRELDTIVIGYDELLSDTERIVGRINEHIPGLRSYAEARQELDAFIDKGLKHHHA